MPRLAHDFFVAGALPLDEVFDEIEEAHARAVAFGLHIFADVAVRGEFAVAQVFAFGDEVRLGLRVFGVVDQGGEDDGAGGGERTARPPQVQGGWVAVADIFLAGAGVADGVQRQGDFDKFLGGGHGGIVAENLNSRQRHRGFECCRGDSVSRPPSVYPCQRGVAGIGWADMRNLTTELDE